MSRHAPHVVGLVVTGYIQHIFQYTPSKSTKIHCCKLFFNPSAAVKYYFGEQTIETIQHQSLSPSRPGRSHPDSLTLQPSLGLHLRGRSVSTIFGTKTCRKKKPPGETPRNTEVSLVSPSNRVAQLLWKPDDMERVVPDNCGENGVPRNPSHRVHRNCPIAQLP